MRHPFLRKKGQKIPFKTIKQSENLIKREKIKTFLPFTSFGAIFTHLCPKSSGMDFYGSIRPIVEPSLAGKIRGPTLCIDAHFASCCSRYSSFMIDIFTCQICHTLHAAMFHIS